MIKSIKDWFKRKPDIRAVSSTTETAIATSDNDGDPLKAILTSKNITHKDLSNLSKLYFATDIESNMYCFRSGGPYGVVLGIAAISHKADETGKLEDITITFKDISMSTSLIVSVSVKDLNELFKPFFHQPVITKAKE